MTGKAMRTCPRTPGKLQHHDAQSSQAEPGFSCALIPALDEPTPIIRYMYTYTYSYTDTYTPSLHRLPARQTPLGPLLPPPPLPARHGRHWPQAQPHVDVVASHARRPPALQEPQRVINNTLARQRRRRRGAHIKEPPGVRRRPQRHIWVGPSHSHGTHVQGPQQQQAHLVSLAQPTRRRQPARRAPAAPQPERRVAGPGQERRQQPPHRRLGPRQVRLVLSCPVSARSAIYLGPAPLSQRSRAGTLARTTTIHLFARPPTLPHCCGLALLLPCPPLVTSTSFHPHFTSLHPHPHRHYPPCAYYYTSHSPTCPPVPTDSRCLAPRCVAPASHHTTPMPAS